MDSRSISMRKKIVTVRNCLCMCLLKISTDINECLGTNPCEQNCNNTIGGFFCSCWDGYALLNDMISCEGSLMDRYIVVSVQRVLNAIGLPVCKISFVHFLFNLPASKTSISSVYVTIVL